MGCRLHHAKTFKVEYTGGRFNWQADELHNILQDYGVQVILWNVDDVYSHWEISKDDLKHLIEKLADKDPAQKAEENMGDHAEITVEDIVSWAQRVLDEADPDLDYVRFAWF